MVLVLGLRLLSLVEQWALLHYVLEIDLREVAIGPVPPFKHNLSGSQRLVFTWADSRVTTRTHSNWTERVSAHVATTRRD